jgi:hypothetical protein
VAVDQRLAHAVLSRRHKAPSGEDAHPHHVVVVGARLHQVDDDRVEVGIACISRRSWNSNARLWRGGRQRQRGGGAHAVDAR